MSHDIPLIVYKMLNWTRWDVGKDIEIGTWISTNGVKMNTTVLVLNDQYQVKLKIYIPCDLDLL